MHNGSYRLGVFWGAYDDIYDTPDVLKSFNSQRELDLFTEKFHNDKELRSYFSQEIGESALDNMEKIKRNETKHGHFRGRISAYYIDKNERINFIKIAYKNRKVVRNYHELRNTKERLSFLKTIFDELEKILTRKEKKKKISYNEKMFIIIKTLGKYGYFISDNEKYYLKIYLETKKDDDKKRLFEFVKINLNNEIEEEKRKMEEMGEYDIEDVRYQVYDLTDQHFSRVFEKAVRNHNFEELFKYYSSEEISKKSNYYEIQGKRRRK